MLGCGPPYAPCGFTWRGCCFWCPYIEHLSVCQNLVGIVDKSILPQGLWLVKTFFVLSFGGGCSSPLCRGLLLILSLGASYAAVCDCSALSRCARCTAPSQPKRIPRKLARASLPVSTNIIYIPQSALAAINRRGRETNLGGDRHAFCIGAEPYSYFRPGVHQAVLVYAVVRGKKRDPTPPALA